MPKESRITWTLFCTNSRTTHEYDKIFIMNEDSVLLTPELRHRIGEHIAHERSASEQLKDVLEMFSSGDVDIQYDPRGHAEMLWVDQLKGLENGTVLTATFESTVVDGNTYDTKVLIDKDPAPDVYGYHLLFHDVEQKAIAPANIAAFVAYSPEDDYVRVSVLDGAGNLVEATDEQVGDVVNEFKKAIAFFDNMTDVLDDDVRVDTQPGYVKPSAAVEHSKYIQTRVVEYPSFDEFDHIQINSLEVHSDLVDFLALHNVETVADFLRVNEESDLIRGYLTSRPEDISKEAYKESIQQLARELKPAGIRLGYTAFTGTQVKLRAKLDHVPAENLGTFVHELGVGARVGNCLQRAGIMTVEELLGYWTQSSLMNIPNFGTKCCQDLAAALSKQGLSLLADPTEIA